MYNTYIAKAIKLIIKSLKNLLKNKTTSATQIEMIKINLIVIAS